MEGSEVVINIESRKMACKGNRITRREQVDLLCCEKHSQFSHLQIVELTGVPKSLFFITTKQSTG